MPSQDSIAKSAMDPTNLLMIAAAIAITLLPISIVMVAQKVTDARAASPASHSNAPDQSEAPIFKATAFR